MTLDGAYDGDTVYDAILQRHPGAAVTIPPRATAVAGETAATQRDQHIAMIEKHGRVGDAAKGSARLSAWNGSGGWQRRAGYNRGSLAETAMFRYKTIIGRRRQARTLPNQRTEAKTGCNVLNRMTAFGMPVSAPVR
jgi:hypothetical protein